MPQLSPEFFASQIFWLLLVFSLIYVLIARCFLPRIGSVVDLRSSKIEADIASSEKIIEDYKAAELSAVKVLEKAKHDAFALVAEATKNAETQIAKRASVIEKDINKATAQKEEGLARLRTQMQGDIEALATDIGQQVTTQLIDKLGFKGK